MPSEEQLQESEPEFEPMKIADLTEEEWKLYSHFKSLIQKDLEEEPSNLFSLRDIFKVFDNLMTYYITKNHRLTWLEKDTMIFTEYEIKEGAIWLTRKGSMTDDMFNASIELYDKFWDLTKTMRQIARTG